MKTGKLAWMTLSLALFVACSGDDSEETPDTDSEATDTDEVTETDEPIDDTDTTTSECEPPVATATTACVYPNGQSNLYDPSMVVDGDTCDPVEDCGFGSMCFQEEGIEAGEATCRRSLDESQSAMPYYDFGCASFSEYIRYQTSLEIDCRCRTVGDGQGGAGGTGDALADPTHTDVSEGARPGGPIINCMPQTSMEDRGWPVQYGTGPSFNAWFQANASGASWFSGTVDPDEREMYGIVKHTSGGYTKAGAVVAWDLDTGNRRVVSGWHPNEGEVGSGYLSPPPGSGTTLQPLSGANVIQFGPDGYLYTFGGGTGEGPADEREIVKIDPATGERTPAWIAQNSDMDDDISGTYGQCLRPDAYPDKYMQSVALNGQAFAMDDAGNFYMSFRGVREGDGLIKVSADAKTCTILAAWGGNGHNPGGGATPAPAVEIGGGPYLQFPIEGLLFHDGKLYGTSNDDLFAWDPATGDGELVTTISTTYGGMGIANLFWDDTRSVIWAVGNHSPYVGTVIDPVTGQKESVFADTEDFQEPILESVYGVIRSVTSPSSVLTNGNTLGNGGFVLDPDNNDIVYGVLKSGGLMKMELSTFNSFVYSW